MQLSYGPVHSFICDERNPSAKLCKQVLVKRIYSELLRAKICFEFEDRHEPARLGSAVSCFYLICSGVSDELDDCCLDVLADSPSSFKKIRLPFFSPCKTFQETFFSR